MAAYQNLAVDEEAFLEFINSPSKKLIDVFVDALASNDEANEYFEDDPPAWSSDPATCVSQRLSENDWYGGLTEGEALAWDSAIATMASRFDCSDSVRVMEHGQVDFDIFQLAERMFEGKDREHQMLQMTPYRFHGISPEIEEVEECYRIYWPSHAMLDVQQLRALDNDLMAFRKQLPDLKISSPSVFDSIEERRKFALEESEELSGYVKRLIDRGAMWFARIDC